MCFLVGRAACPTETCCTSYQKAGHVLPRGIGHVLVLTWPCGFVYLAMCSYWQKNSPLPTPLGKKTHVVSLHKPTTANAVASMTFDGRWMPQDLSRSLLVIFNRYLKENEWRYSISLHTWHSHLRWESLEARKDRNLRRNIENFGYQHWVRNCSWWFCHPLSSVSTHSVRTLLFQRFVDVCMCWWWPGVGFRAYKKLSLQEVNVSDLPNGDRFKLAIPYAGHSVTCEYESPRFCNVSFLTAIGSHHKTLFRGNFVWLVSSQSRSGLHIRARWFRLRTRFSEFAGEVVLSSMKVANWFRIVALQSVNQEAHSDLQCFLAEFGEMEPRRPDGIAERCQRIDRGIQEIPEEASESGWFHVQISVQFTARYQTVQRGRHRNSSHEKGAAALPGQFCINWSVDKKAFLACCS